MSLFLSMFQLFIINFCYIIIQYAIGSLIIRIDRSIFDFPWPSCFWDDHHRLFTNKIECVQTILSLGLILVCPLLLIYLTYQDMTGQVITLQFLVCVLPFAILYVVIMLICFKHRKVIVPLLIR
jgi:hypothetical protein